MFCWFLFQLLKEGKGEFVQRRIGDAWGLLLFWCGGERNGV